MMLGGASVVAAEEEITFPPELRLSGEMVPKDKNGMVRLLEHLTPPDQKLTEKMRLATSQLRSGKAIEDTDLLKELRGRHEVAERWLKPPVQCLRRSESGPVITVVFNLFRGAEILSRQSALEGDYDTAGKYLATVLEWSRLIWNGNPTAVEALVGHSGWRTAFSIALQEWEQHPDQEEGLKDLTQLFAKNRIRPDEWAVVIRREAQWWADLGGTKGCLDLFPKEQGVGVLLFKEPFSELTPEQLRQLPYDEKAELARYTDEALAQLRCLRNREPLQKWPDFNEEDHKDQTLENYRKRPNGLGDLLKKQSTRLAPIPQLVPFFADPAIETCLTWLKTEQSHKTFTPDSSNTGRDPVDGKLLRVDTARRTIHSVGLDLLTNEVKGDPPKPGFAIGPEDPTLVVPRWRAQK